MMPQEIELLFRIKFPLWFEKKATYRFRTTKYMLGLSSGYPPCCKKCKKKIKSMRVYLMGKHYEETEYHFECAPVESLKKMLIDEKPEEEPW